MILSAITSPVAGPIGAGVSFVLALTLGATIITKNATISELRDDKKALQIDRDRARDDLHQCRANALVLTDAITRQNGAAAIAQAETERRLAALNKVAQDAKASESEAARRAAAILNTKGATCEDADALILGATK